MEGRGSTMKIEGYIVVTFKFQKEGRKWTAYCEELGTASFGRSIQEAYEKIKEATLLHLNTLEELGERERFFRENNITLHTHKPKKITGQFDTKTYTRPFIYHVLKEKFAI